MPSFRGNGYIELVTSPMPLVSGAILSRFFAEFYSMQPNPACWFEIYVDDLDRATKFYESVLGLKLEDLPSPMPALKMRAFPMTMDGPGASGTLCKMDGVCAGGGSTIIYFSCQDCGIEASRIEAAGGEVRMPKTSIGEYGYMALGVDSEGNMFELHSS